MAGSLPRSVDGRLTLLTLGRVELRPSCPAEARAEPSLLAPGKPLALLAYLACTPAREASRELLLDLLWSDLDPEAGRHALRQTLWFLRRRLGDHVVAGATASLRLTEAIDTDRDAFLDALAAGESESALRLYAGEFLPGFAMPGGGEFEQWADLERQRLRLLFMRSAESAARAALGRGRARDAAEIARRIRDVDPDRELGWRVLIEAQLAAGNAVVAAAEADALEQRLARDERTPEAATRAVLRLARQAPDGATGDAPSGGQMVAELVGREAEFAAILAAWGDVRRGHHRVLHVSARAGLGKTRLLDDVRTRIRASRARVVAVRAEPGERGIPYAFAAHVANALAQLPGAAAIAPAVASTLVGLDPRLSSVYCAAVDGARDEDPLRRRTVAVHDLLAATAEEQPVALLLDDLHWADEASFRLLVGVIARSSGSRVLVVTASRPEHGTEPPWTRDATLPLRSLEPEEVLAFVASLGALPDEPWAHDFPAQLCDACDGTPLLILEALTALVERRILEREGSSWSCGDPEALSSSLGSGSGLRDRVARLAPEERTALLALAVAGVPLAEPVICRVVRCSDAGSTAALANLELRGLAVRSDGGWQPAHDVIAESALVLACREERTAIERTLGEALLAGDTPSDAELRLAGAHLLWGGDAARASRAFLAWARRQRSLGDRRSIRALAADFAPDVTAAQELARQAPWSLRLSSTVMRTSLVAGLVLATGSAAFFRVATPRPLPDAVLYVRVGDSDSLGYRVPLRRADFSEALPIALENGRYARRVLPSLTTQASPNIGIDARRGWLVTELTGDSGVADIFLVRDGRRRRLTFSRGEDMNATWAPTGDSYAYASARFDSLDHYDIVVGKLGTTTIRRLTSGPESDALPSWNPIGTLIGFTRLAWDGKPPAICHVAPDGSDLACFPMPPGSNPAIRAWYDGTHALVETRDTSSSDLLLVDMQSGERSVVRRSTHPGVTYVVSPDGRWVVRFTRVLGGDSHAIVFPVDAPDMTRELWGSTPDVTVSDAIFDDVAPRSHALERLAIVAPPGGAPAGVGTRLRVTGADEAGNPVAPGRISWTVIGAAGATIDSDGVLLAPDSGTVRVRASAGGWRTTEAVIRVAPPRSRLLLTETWSADAWTRWAPFGHPKPRIVANDGIRAFLNDGDGSFPSGAYLRTPLSTRDGLAIDATISAPVTALQWQNLMIDISVLDSAGLARWDHDEGGLPEVAAAQQLRCGVTIPAGERLPLARQIDAAGAASDVRSVYPRALTGAWTRIRVQLFPDGRCGAAVDGRAIGIAENRTLAGPAVYVALTGQSVGARMLVGPLTVWSGVLTDIDWTRARHR